jgi:hypothetical protein
VQQDQGQQIISIAPTAPDTVYVPYYDPAVVYGGWPYADYPPYYFPPPAGYIAAGVLATVVAFGAGYALGRWASGANWSGGGFHWRNGNIVVNRPNNVNVRTANWQHNSYHRRGVAYANANVARRFGGSAAGGNRANINFRGSCGNQVLKPNATNINRATGVGGSNRATGAGAGNRGNTPVGSNRRTLPTGAHNLHRGAGTAAARAFTGARSTHVGGGRSIAVGGGRTHVGGGGRGGGRRR